MVYLRQEANAMGHKNSGLDRGKKKKKKKKRKNPHLPVVTVGTSTTPRAIYYHIFGTGRELSCQCEMPGEIHCAC